MIRWVLWSAGGWMLMWLAGPTGEAAAQDTSTTTSSAVIRPSDDDGPPSASPRPTAHPVDLRVQAIHHRIEVLKEVLARQQAMAEAAANQKPPPEATPAPQAVPNTETPEIPPVAPLRDPAFNDPGNGSSLTERPHESPRAAIPLEMTGTPILSAPVLSLELGHSLALTGNYAQAIQCYESLLATELNPVEQNWLRCLAANCYRLKKDLASAERIYREIVSSKDHSFPSDHAKWYLDHVTRRKQLESALQAIETELDSFRQPRGQ